MKIAILSRRPRLYSTQRLVTEGKARGHTVRVIDTLRCYMGVTAHEHAIRYRGARLPYFDAVIPRLGASITAYGAAVLRQFEVSGVFSLNNALAITRSRDKLRTVQLLAKKRIGLPITGFADSPDDIDDLIKMVGGAPLVIKLLEGTQGIGVVLAETKQAARSVIEAFLGLDTYIIVQEYIKEANGRDIRCFVLGDRVVAAMERHAVLEDFRSNLHRGGTAYLTTITAEERSMAVRAVKILGLHVAGVDLLRSDRGPLVLEVNSSPGLEGIEKVTGENIAGMVIKYVEKNVETAS